MYIGSLISHHAPIDCYYTYRERGTSLPLFPDLHQENYRQEKYSILNGNLMLGAKVGFLATTVLNVGVDIAFSFSKKCFVDHLLLNQGESSCIYGIEVIDSSCSEQEKIIGRYFPATGKGASEKEIRIDVGAYAKEMVLRVHTAVSNFVIEKLDVLGALLEEELLWPLPFSGAWEKGEGFFPLQENVYVSIDQADENLSFVTALFAEKLEEGWNVLLEETKSSNKENCIHFVHFDPKETRPEESFSIEVTPLEVKICAGDKRGFLYGMEAFLSLISDRKVPVVSFFDHPYKPFRGIHIYSLPERKDLEFFKRFVKYMLLPLRYNTMVVEVCGGMRYERHPEITEKWIEACEAYNAGTGLKPAHCGCVEFGTIYEKDEVREIVSYIKSFGIEVIPEVQSLGHVQYLTHAFPEIAEIAEKDDFQEINMAVGDQVATRFAPPCYCPSNERSYEIILDVMDEIIEVFQPERYVHVGHDEVKDIGVCSICKTKDASDLLAEHLNRLYAHLAKYNLKMMIWSDMLQNITSERTSYLYLNTLPAIHKIPKDIVMCDFIWYFNLEHDIENHLVDHGFPVVVGNLYSSLYPRYEKRIKNQLGGLTATWVNTAEYDFAQEGKMYETTYIATMLWSGAYEEKYRLTYNELMKKLLSHFRSKIRNEKLPPATILIGEGIEELPTGLRNLSKETGFEKIHRISAKKEMNLSVSDTYSHLSFLHATEKNAKRICWQPLVVVGEYQVVFEDGTTETIPLEYGGNICELKRPYGKPLKEAYYRHQGYIGTYFSDPAICSKSDRGEDVTVYEFSWVNPKPEQKIKKIIGKKIGDTDTDILLFAVKGSKK